MAVDDSDLALGDLVLINKKYRAVVRYIGTTTFAEGVWFGLELEREIGAYCSAAACPLAAQRSRRARGPARDALPGG